MSKSTKLFVSGKFNDRKLIRDKMDELEKLGYTITHDWTTKEKCVGDKNLRIAGIEDINRVKDCDLHIIVITDPEYPYCGTFAELGCSLGLNKIVFIYCPFEKTMCMDVPFYYHPLIMHYSDWNTLLNNLESISKNK